MKKEISEGLLKVFAKDKEQILRSDETPEEYEESRKKWASKYAKLLGSRGGKQSAKSRFDGKTKEEISEIMRKLRYSRKDLKQMGEESVEALNRSQTRSKP